MSWSCDICGGGREAEHQLCSIVEALRDIRDDLRRIANVFEDKRIEETLSKTLFRRIE